MANPVAVITIQPCATVEELRRQLEGIMNDFALRMTDTKLTAPLDANGNRINNLKNAVNDLDAVNLRTMRSAIAASRVSGRATARQLSALVTDDGRVTNHGLVVTY